MICRATIARTILGAIGKFQLRAKTFRTSWPCNCITLNSALRPCKTIDSLSVCDTILSLCLNCDSS